VTGSADSRGRPSPVTPRCTRRLAPRSPTGSRAVSTLRQDACQRPFTRVSLRRRRRRQRRSSRSQIANTLPLSSPRSPTRFCHVVTTSIARDHSNGAAAHHDDHRGTTRSLAARALLHLPSHRLQHAIRVLPTAPVAYAPHGSLTQLALRTPPTCPSSHEEDPAQLRRESNAPHRRAARLQAHPLTPIHLHLHLPRCTRASGQGNSPTSRTTTNVRSPAEEC
jgi:hypothetical protein